MKVRLLVTPYSLSIDALEATIAGIEGLPGSNEARRERSGAPILDAGRLIINTNNPGFVEFAIAKQGYAKSVEREAI